MVKCEKRGVSISAVEKVFIYRQLGVMLHAGIPIVKALDAVSRSCRKIGDREVWQETAQEVSEGNTLTKAFGRHQDYFALVEVGLVRAGELSCTLAEIFSDLANYYLLSNNLKRRIAGAVQYPIILCLAMFLLIMVISVHVLPAFTPILESGSGQSIFTRLLLEGITITQNWLFWWGFGFVLALMVAIYKLYGSAPQFTKNMQYFMLTWPLLGKIIKSVVVTRFCHTMSLMVRSGLPLDTSLQIVGLALANYPLAKVTDEAAALVHSGCDLGEALGQTNYFSPNFIKTINVAMQSSHLEEALDRLSRFYNEQVVYSLDRFSSLVEPLLLAVMGVFVSGLLLALFTPLYSFMDSL